MALALGVNFTMTKEIKQLAVRVAIGVALFLVATYVLIGIPILENRKLEAAIIAEKAAIDHRQKLMPILTSMSFGTDNATLTGMLAPKAEPMPRAQAYRATEELAGMAAAAGMETLDVSLNTASMGAGGDTLQVQGVFGGQIEGVNALLLAVGRMQCLARMERVEIRAVDGRLEMMLILRINLGG